MPRTHETYQRIHTEQRARILEAARRVFARKGLDATVDDVAAEAGISHGLAYLYFANKAALFSELVSEDLQASTGGLERFAAAHTPPMDRLRQMVTGLVESRRDHPEHYRLLTQVLNDETAPGDLREQVAQRGQAMRAVLRGLIAAGQASGEAAAGDPDQLVRAIFASLDGLTAWHAADPEAYHRDFPDAEIFLRMLRP